MQIVVDHNKWPKVTPGWVTTWLLSCYFHPAVRMVGMSRILGPSSHAASVLTPAVSRRLAWALALLVSFCCCQAHQGKEPRIRILKAGTVVTAPKAGTVVTATVRTPALSFACLCVHARAAGSPPL